MEMAMADDLEARRLSPRLPRIFVPRSSANRAEPVPYTCTAARLGLHMRASSSTQTSYAHLYLALYRHSGLPMV